MFMTEYEAVHVLVSPCMSYKKEKKKTNLLRDFQEISWCGIVTVMFLNITNMVTAGLKYGHRNLHVLL
jgi:hypothetical protein